MMADQDNTKPPKLMTLDEAAKRVRCTVADVLSFRDYGSYVVVVTKDGKKLSNEAHKQ